MSTLGTQSATVARVATSTAAVTLLAVTVARKMVHIYNDSAAVLYVKFGAAASATDFTVALAATTGYYETPSGFPYSGLVTGILASGTGNAQVTSY